MLLKEFLRNNKERRLKLAMKAGFSSIEDYITSFTSPSSSNVKIEVKIKKKKSNSKKTIQVCDVLDLSGSMMGSKIEAAIRGINIGIQDLQQNKEVEYLYSLITFQSYSTKIVFRDTAIKNVGHQNFHADGGTPLNDAIGDAISMFKNSKGPVLINVYTDGEENTSRRFTSKEIADLIDRYQKTITVTFIGTEYDVKQATENFNLDLSNTMSYDGSSAGLEKSLNATRDARITYTTSVLNNQDVSKNFYKEFNK